jgi:prolyl oligopeptidase
MYLSFVFSYRRQSTLWGAVLLVILAAASLAAAQNVSQPVAPVREVTDHHFGTKIVDPYRWMEDPGSAELAAWMKAQSAFTRRSLDSSPRREMFLRRLESQNTSTVNVTGIERVGDRYFYFKIEAGDTDRKIFVRDGLNGVERMLVDPKKISNETGRRVSIISFEPSPDGEMLSYLAASGGAEVGEIRIVETATGKERADRLSGSRWTAGSWLPDGSALLYVRFPPFTPGQPATERYQKQKVYLHRLGDSREQDTAIFGHQVNARLDIAPQLLAFPFVPKDSRHAFINVTTGVSPNGEYYVAPVESLSTGSIPWRKINSFEDQVGAYGASGVVVHGSSMYLLTYKNAPRYKVTKVDLESPDLTKAKTIIDVSDAVNTDLASAKDALYVQQKDGGTGRLLRIDHKTGAVEPIELPFEGSVSGLTADPREPGVLFRMNSWIRTPTQFRYEPATRTVIDTGLQPRSPLDTSQLESLTVEVRSHDGTLVPLSIISKKGIKRDGRNFAAISGYGAYGISTEPRMLEQFFPWVEAGGIVAFAHVRGGGEYGVEWHQAGFKSTKPNTWRDFIACAQYLIKAGYTSPQFLAGHGASAGGIPIGNAIAERPDLFGAAIIGVGLNNMLRYETTANGVLNIPEFGSVKDEQGFRDLLAMDAYHKVKPGVEYPAVMLTHGINDPRVEPWLSAKMAARLQASSTSGKPILLRIDYDAGHGVGNSRRQLNEEFADMFAFLFDQFEKARVSPVR